MTSDDGMDVVVTETLSQAVARQAAEIERLRAKEIVFQPPAIPESFVIQELQKANVALHAEIARLRSKVRCPHCDELRLDLGDARREIERLCGLLQWWLDAGPDADWDEHERCVREALEE